MDQPPPFHVMIKPRGPVCNLNCTYCYYLPKDKLYPNSDFVMRDELLQDFTKQYIHAQPYAEVVFGWQGGEPTLLGIDFFKRAVTYQQKHRRPGMRIINSIQTNGTMLNVDWSLFFRKHDFLVGVSLDGPPELHDSFRRDRGGETTSNQVLKSLALLRKYNVEHNILCAVHAKSVEHPLEVYRFLRDEIQARYVQFIPIVKPITQANPAHGIATYPESIPRGKYGEFLINVFDEWVRNDVGKVFVQIFDVALAAWMGERPGLCIFEDRCGSALALEHNGDLFSCDHFVDPAYMLGNIQQAPLLELATSPKQLQFGEAKLSNLPTACLDCAVRFVCNGGCPKNRFVKSEGEERPRNYLCSDYLNFFTQIDRPMQMMVEHLRHRRAPAQVMADLKKGGNVLQ